MAIVRRPLFNLSCVAAMLVTSSVHAGGIPKEDRPLTSRNGPWMIQVTAFRAADDPDAAKGLGDRLVRELREKGIPAYSILRRIEEASDPEQNPTVIVLAGNYRSRDSRIAARTLAWVRDLADSPMAKLLTRVSGKKRPLESAFLCPNPRNDAIELE